MFLHLKGGIFLLFSSFMLWSSVFAVDYCDKHDCSPKTFVRKMSWKKDDNGVAEPKIQDEQLLENKCWKYTWMGPENENTNKSQPCPQGPDYEDQACLPPLVWTTGPNKHNQPNTTELLEKCSAGQTEENTICEPYCVKNEKTCIKMTYRNRDKEKTVFKTVSFCGQARDTYDGNAALKSGCFTQENQDGVDVEACFCDSDMCNGSVVTSNQVSLTFGLALFIVLSCLL